MQLLPVLPRVDVPRVATMANVNKLRTHPHLAPSKSPPPIGGETLASLALIFFKSSLPGRI